MVGRWGDPSNGGNDFEMGEAGEGGSDTILYFQKIQHKIGYLEI